MRRKPKVSATISLWAALCIAASAPTLDLDAAKTEVARAYGKAHPEVQEFVLHTARAFGKSGMWLNENASEALKAEEREQRIGHLARLFDEAEYGRHLCAALAEASTIKDPRLVPGLMKIAGHHVEGKVYDCRPKWIAIAALPRQESPYAVPLLVSLVDHGNQNTKFWARAALARLSGEDFETDKQAWNKWWTGKGNAAIDAKFLKPFEPPASARQP